MAAKAVKNAQAQAVAPSRKVAVLHCLALRVERGPSDILRIAHDVLESIDVRSFGFGPLHHRLGSERDLS